MLFLMLDASKAHINICHFSEVDLLLVWGGILLVWFTVCEAHLH